MPEYSCFLHPTQKSEALTDLCPQCGEPYEFPLTQPPDAINGKQVVRAINRGYYGAVYEVSHPRLRDRRLAVKVMPKDSYDSPREQGGHGKNFALECRLHEDLSHIPSVARIEDFGEELLTFGTHEVVCYWMELEFISGRTLADYLTAGPTDPCEIAQIACDLLDFLAELEQHDNRYHNDLHDGNIVIVRLDRRNRRRDAIAPSIQTKILDLGSAADRSKSQADGRFNDTHQVALHILHLLNAFEASHTPLPPSTQAICWRLRLVAQLYCSSDRARLPGFDDVRRSILEVCRHQGYWWEQPLRLASVSAGFNAASMESFYAGRLLHDPGNRWRNKVLQEGTLILTGMRGCGKTILLRSIDWQARAYCAEGESDADVNARLNEDAYLGLFVSCASLMRGPRPNAPSQVFRRLLLSYALEVIRYIQTCQVRSYGQVYYHELDKLHMFLSECAPWYVPPEQPRDPFAVEGALLQACNAPNVEDQSLGEPNPRDLFDAFVARVRALCDLLATKKVLLLLDDVSVRFLSPASVDQIFAKLCFQSTDFAFKLSSESQTITMTSPGGGLAQLGRDYEMFDLGDEVFDRLRSKEGLAFVEEILRRRLEVTDGVPRTSPATLLGRQSLMAIARAIRNRPREDQSKKYVYWGLDALAGICVGDIGDILFLFDAILAGAPAGPQRIPEKSQHTAILNFAEDRLRRFAVAQDKMHAHAMAFAQASHRELVGSSEQRIRQYAEIFIKIDPNDVAELFPEILKLIEEGVFVPTGGTPRTKHRKRPFLQLKLAYRKLWGLTSLIPLSMKDRFELSGDALRQWLSEPTVDRLLRAVRKQVNSESEYEMPVEPTLFDGADSGEDDVDSRSVEFAAKGRTRLNGCVSRISQTVCTEFSGLLEDVEIDSNEAVVVAGLGFEDRSIGAWINLLSKKLPGKAVLLRYAQSGDLNLPVEKRIVELLREHGVAYDIVDTETVPDDACVEQIVSKCEGARPALDTTSLTKPLIYGLVRDSLCRYGDAVVYHTCAEEYFPSEEMLAAIVSHMEAGRYRQGISELDEVVSGELGPYNCIRIGKAYSDPTRPTFLAIFVSLKYAPVQQVLKRGMVEELAALYPLHSKGEDTARSFVGRSLADYFAELYHGRSEGIGSLDHIRAFDCLMELHGTYALEKEYNFEISLTGTKMHAVAAGMFGSVVTPANVWYSRPSAFDPKRFTNGSAETRVVCLKRVLGEAAN